MVLCFIGLSSLLLLLSGLVFYGTYSEIAYREIRETKIELLEETSRKLSNYVTGIQDTALIVVTNTLVHQYLSAPPDSVFDYVSKSRDLYEELQRLVTMKAGLHSIELYTDWAKGYPPYSVQYMYPLEAADAEGWLPRMDRSDGFWLSAHPGRDAASSVQMVSYVHRIIGNRGEILGIAKLNIPVGKLFDNLSRRSSSSLADDYYVILDASGGYIASELPEGIAASSRVEDLQREVADTRYSVIQSAPSSQSWMLIQLISKDVLRQNGEQIGKLVFGLLIALILLSIPLAFWVSKRLTAPINGIVDGMRSVEKGDFNVRLQSSSIQEYLYLTTHFNRMIQRLRDLIGRLNQEHRDRREAEMLLLQTQIKPHFLYNTLDLIHWRALDHNAHDISMMVKQLSKLFRIGLSNDKWYVTVRDELAHARCYMAIQEFRQKFNIEYKEIVESDLLDCLMPKIVLQPFLENAVVHGFRFRSEAASVQVRFERRQEAGSSQLVVTIADNGSGFPEGFDLASSGGIGIRNVLDRIQLYCGPKYGVRISEGEQGGAQVTLHLPLIRDENEMEQLTRSLSHEYDSLGG